MPFCDEDIPNPTIQWQDTARVSARWIISNDPGRNDPWSGMFSVVVAIW